MPPRKPDYTTSHHTGGLTHREIAAILGISRTRVQQIESRAFEKIRREMRRAKLRPEDFYGPPAPFDPTIYIMDPLK